MIKILTHYTENFAALADITIANMGEYCYKHGYGLVYYIVPQYQKYTGADKLVLIKNELGIGDIGLVVDADVMITNHNINIEEYIDNEHYFYICRDINSINSGTFLIKQSKWAEEFIWYISNELETTDIDCEQNAIECYMKEFPNDTKIKILPHPSINSYPIDYYAPSYGKIGYADGEIVPKPTHKKGAWQEGDFICHCPGLPLSQRIEIFKNIKVIK